MQERGAGKVGRPGHRPTDRNRPGRHPIANHRSDRRRRQGNTQDTVENLDPAHSALGRRLAAIAAVAGGTESLSCGCLSPSHALLDSSTLEETLVGCVLPDIRSVTPVSYTHLRAHETRHDLVCRLL